MVQRDSDLDCGEECLNIFDTVLVTSHLHNAQLRPLRRMKCRGKIDEIFEVELTGLNLRIILPSFLQSVMRADSGPSLVVYVDWSHVRCHCLSCLA